MLHLPWRSREQLGRKAHGGAAALDAGGLHAGVGQHWRVLAAAGEAGLDATWRALIGGEYVPGLEWAPCGPMVITRPFNTAQHWYDEVRRSSAGR